MNQLAMEAIVTVLCAAPAVSALVDRRVTWDTEESDPKLPAVTLRTLATTIPARDLTGRGGVRRSMIELAANADTVTGSSQLLEACLAALEPHESGPIDVTVPSGVARIASIFLDDVTQSPPVRERSYRQTAVLITTFYE